MCGIIGGFSSEVPNPRQVLGTIIHRGPDSQGFFVDGKLFLGHTRLSIQDLSENGNQPMFSKDKRFVIVFNGEIYNHLEIRKMLVDVDFKSTGDTETVLYAFIKFGSAALNLFNGIFAFAIYDTFTKELFIARDHFGVKPLYFYNDGISFLFGSEIKSFFPFNIKKDLINEAFINYLSFLWSPGEVTPFKYVKKLLPGSYLNLNLNDFSSIQQVFYNNDNGPTGTFFDISEEDAINKLDFHLCQAVERQLLSDVPVGFFLSGGLDSTLLVAIAKKLHPNLNFPCYTINTKVLKDGNEGFADDLHYAKEAALFLGVELNVVNAEIDIVNDFDKMIWHLDEPQADPAPLHVLNIASLAREKGIKVLIGGTAGDDIFSGYRRHIALQYEYMIERIPLMLRKFIKSTSNFLPVKVPLFRRIKKFVQNFDKSQNDRMIGYFDWMDISTIKKLFNKEIQKDIENYNVHDFFQSLLNKIPSEHNMLNKMLFLERNTFLVDHNLNYTDKMAMAVGVEVRVPYLDRDLVAFAQKLNPNLKLKGLETKYLLKKVAERYLPKEIIYRPKSGFGAPVRKWITDEMSGMIQERLSEENIIRQGIFDYEKVQELVHKNKSGSIDASYTIWSLLAISSWLDQFLLHKNSSSI